MRFELPPGLVEVHRMRMPVRWGDMDALGHVNNALYLRYFETLRLDWLQGLGAPPSASGIGPVMANAFCNFRRSVAFPDELLAIHWLGPAGRSSLDTYFTLARVDEPDVVCAEGGCTLVWVDAASGRSAAVPEAVRALAPAPLPPPA